MNLPMADIANAVLDAIAFMASDEFQIRNLCLNLKF
jgi:hypothetical protein